MCHNCDLPSHGHHSWVMTLVRRFLLGISSFESIFRGQILLYRYLVTQKCYFQKEWYQHFYLQKTPEANTVDVKKRVPGSERILLHTSPTFYEYKYMFMYLHVCTIVCIHTYVYILFRLCFMVVVVSWMEKDKKRNSYVLHVHTHKFFTSTHTSIHLYVGIHARAHTCRIQMNKVAASARKGSQ